MGFAGTPALAAKVLSAILAAGFEVPLVVTRPDAPQGRGLKVSPSAVKTLALSRGLEIQINWAGRIGVAPIAGAPFFAMAGVHWLALIMLYVGMAFGLTATVLYVRRGAQELRARKARNEPGKDPAQLSS